MTASPVFVPHQSLTAAAILNRLWGLLGMELEDRPGFDCRPLFSLFLVCGRHRSTVRFIVALGEGRELSSQPSPPTQKVQSEIFVLHADAL